MKHSETIRRYLRNRDEVDIQPTGFPFVTIARQAGVDGHALGREIIRQLIKRDTRDEWAQGWDLYDHQLCLLIVQDPQVKTSFESLVEEEYRPESRLFIPEMLAGASQQHMVTKRVLDVVRLLGLLGRVVIVGRAGNFVTRGLPGGLHVRLVAPESVRLRNMMELVPEGEEAARKALRRQDRDRERLADDFFNGDVSDSVNYDLTLNAGRLSLIEMAHCVVQMLVFKAHGAAGCPKA